MIGASIPLGGISEKVTGTADSFLGKAVLIGMVTRDAVRSMSGMWGSGIGPWRVYTFDSHSMTDQTHRGGAAAFALRVCLAKMGEMTWELIQPLSGRTVFTEFLDKQGEGIHHIAFDCNGLPFDARIQRFADRGFALAQSGCWLGRVPFALFECREATKTCISTFEFPADWEYPEPEAWYPAPGSEP